MERKKITRDYWNHLSETVSVSGVRHAYKEAAMSFEFGLSGNEKREVVSCGLFSRATTGYGLPNNGSETVLWLIFYRVVDQSRASFRPGKMRMRGL
jgi:hypothetical protein